MENQTGKHVKVLKIDNGLEYLSEEFAEFCKDNGIARHRIVGLIPQQNGVAERMNITILERVRCMQSNAKLNNFFWGKAVTTACYLIKDHLRLLLSSRHQKNCGLVNPQIMKTLGFLVALLIFTLMKESLSQGLRREFFLVIQKV